MRHLRGIRWTLAILGLAVAGAGVSACNMQENKKATAACGRAANSTACKACCGMHGSNVNSYVSGSCTCY